VLTTSELQTQRAERGASGFLGTSCLLQPWASVPAASGGLHSPVSLGFAHPSISTQLLGIIILKTLTQAGVCVVILPGQNG
jgi:hypothetical protein